MAEKLKITLNDKKRRVKPDITILQAAREAGIFIPTLCHVEGLEPFASCFICVVEVEGRPNLVPSCATKVADGMVIHTETKRIEEARKTCVELLLSDHVGDCLGPCMAACPAGIDIPGYIKHIALGKDQQALDLIRHNMPLAGILGRVCTRPCEAVCRRQLVDKPIAICQLKRFAADQGSLDEPPLCEPSTGRRVAIVGAGPAGLTAAYYLQLLGHACTVYDAHETAGGMVRYGIPSYRLPRNIIEEEVAVIERLGATFRYNTRLGADITLTELREDFDAVFLALGAQRASSMRVKGEDLPGVLTGIGFLGEASRNEALTIGNRVMVVGGGNTAIDAARTALRLGAGEVTVLYRRTRHEMPAWEEEIVAAEEEGVNLELLAAPVLIERNDDGSLKATCIRMALGEPDQSGRRRPMPLDGSEHTREYDNIIAAIGQGVDGGAADRVEQSRWGSLEIDAQTMRTNLPEVFAGGDCVNGADIAVTAVRDGRRAAIAIDQLIMGEKVVGDPAPYNHSMGALEDVPKAVYEHFSTAKREKMPHLPPASRSRSFLEVETGFTEEQARAEAKRCMECGCRDAHECRLREYAGITGADQHRLDGDCRPFEIDLSHPEIVHESSKCIQCGSCVRISEEILGTSSMGFVGRGFTSAVKPALSRLLGEVDGRGLTKLVEACPTGALTQKRDPVATLRLPIQRPEKKPRP